MHLHDEVELVPLRVKSNSRLLHSLESEILGSDCEVFNFATVVLDSLHHLVRVGCGVAAVLRRDASLLILLVQ